MDVSPRPRPMILCHGCTRCLALGPEGQLTMCTRSHFSKRCKGPVSLPCSMDSMRRQLDRIPVVRGRGYNNRNWLRCMELLLGLGWASLVNITYQDIHRFASVRRRRNGRRCRKGGDGVDKKKNKGTGGLGKPIHGEPTNKKMKIDYLLNWETPHP